MWPKEPVAVGLMWHSSEARIRRRRRRRQVEWTKLIDLNQNCCLDDSKTLKQHSIYHHQSIIPETLKLGTYQASKIRPTAKMPINKFGPQFEARKWCLLTLVTLVAFTFSLESYSCRDLQNTQTIVSGSALQRHPIINSDDQSNRKPDEANKLTDGTQIQQAASNSLVKFDTGVYTQPLDASEPGGLENPNALAAVNLITEEPLVTAASKKKKKMKMMKKKKKMEKKHKEWKKGKKHKKKKYESKKKKGGMEKKKKGKLT